MKTPVPGILHTSKLCLEAWLCGMRACYAIFGTEVERFVVPLAVDIDKIIELRIRWRWLEIFRLQDCLDKLVRLGGDFHLPAVRLACILNGFIRPAQFQQPGDDCLNTLCLTTDAQELFVAQ